MGRKTYEDLQEPPIRWVQAEVFPSLGYGDAIYPETYEPFAPVQTDEDNTHGREINVLISSAPKVWFNKDDMRTWGLMKEAKSQ